MTVELTWGAVFDTDLRIGILRWFLILYCNGEGMHIDVTDWTVGAIQNHMRELEEWLA